MYDSRTNWRKPGRDYLDPELENVMASSLIEISQPHAYASAAYQVGTASIIAGALLILISVYGSTIWTTSMAQEVGQRLLTVAVMGILCSLVGAVVTIASEILTRYSLKR